MEGGYYHCRVYLGFSGDFLGSLKGFEFPRDAIAFLVLILVLMFCPPKERSTKPNSL